MISLLFKDLKYLGYAKWRDVTKYYTHRGYARDQVKGHMMILISKADVVGELPEGF